MLLQYFFLFFYVYVCFPYAFYTLLCVQMELRPSSESDDRGQCCDGSKTGDLDKSYRSRFQHSILSEIYIYKR